MKILRSRAALAATFVLAGALAVPLLASSAAATTHPLRPEAGEACSSPARAPSPTASTRT